MKSAYPLSFFRSCGMLVAYSVGREGKSMEQSIFDSLSEITQALKDGKVRGKQANNYLAKCIADLLNLEADTDSEIENVLWEYLPIFERLILLLPNGDVEVPYYRSIVAIIRVTIRNILQKPNAFTWHRAPKILAGWTGPQHCNILSRF